MRPKREDRTALVLSGPSSGRLAEAEKVNGGARRQTICLSWIVCPLSARWPRLAQVPPPPPPPRQLAAVLGHWLATGARFQRDKRARAEAQCKLLLPEAAAAAAADNGDTGPTIGTGQRGVHGRAQGAWFANNGHADGGRSEKREKCASWATPPRGQLWRRAQIKGHRLVCRRAELTFPKSELGTRKRGEPLKLALAFGLKVRVSGVHLRLRGPMVALR